jgi:hypothetical protein
MKGSKRIPKKIDWGVAPKNLFLDPPPCSRRQGVYSPMRMDILLHTARPGPAESKPHRGEVRLGGGAAG